MEADQPPVSLERLPRPEGASPNYRYYKFLEDDTLWKVRVLMQEGREPSVEVPSDQIAEGVQLAPAEYAVSITVSPIDPTGSVLCEEGKPVVLDGITHTFTFSEMSLPGFDPTSRIERIVSDIIRAQGSRVTAVPDIKNAISNWTDEP